MTACYDLPDKFYDKMTLKQQIAYLRKHKIPVPVAMPKQKRKQRVPKR